jgi:hypothetical protein
MLDKIIDRGKRLIDDDRNEKAKAVRKHMERSPQARAMDERRQAERVTRDYREWADDPSRADYPGVDDPRHPVERFSTIAPPTNHHFDEHNVPTGVAEMAGYGRRGFDAMEGVDALVMDGGPDAVAELDVDSNTRGPPMALAPEESIYRDDEGWGDMDGGLWGDNDDDFDWMGGL